MQLSLLSLPQEEVVFSTRSISPELQNILHRIVITDHEGEYHADLPKLPRPLYDEFKTFISGLRGRWNRSKNTHIFTYDPTSKIAQCLKIGRYPEPNPLAFFPTPKLLIDDMLTEVDLATWTNRTEGKIWYSFQDDHTHYQKDVRILEPSAGTGAIASHVRDIFPEAPLDVIELDPFNREILKGEGFNVIGEDFLTTPPQEYDVILMNPPFSVKGDSTAYITHIERAFDYWLAEGGDLAAIAPASLLWDSSDRVKNFRNRVALYGDWYKNEDKAFVESGTNANTVLIKMRKHTEADLERFGEPAHGYPSRHAYYICLHLDNEYEFMKSLEAFNPSTPRKRIENLVDSWVGRLIKDGNTFYYPDSVRQQVVDHCISQLEVE